MFVRREARHHLLIWVNIVAKIPQAVAEFLHVWFEQVNLAGDINKLGKAPIWKMLYLAIIGLWAGGCLIEASRLFLRSSKQNCLKHASAKKDHRKMCAYP